MIHFFKLGRYVVQGFGVWPDLSKIRHFGQNLKVFGHFLKPSFRTGEIIEPASANFIAFGQIFIGVSGQILKIFLPSGHTSKVHKGSFTLSAFSAADCGRQLHFCRDRNFPIFALTQVHCRICRPLRQVWISLKLHSKMFVNWNSYINRASKKEVCCRIMSLSFPFSLFRPKLF